MKFINLTQLGLSQDKQKKALFLKQLNKRIDRKYKELDELAIQINHIEYDIDCLDYLYGIVNSKDFKE